MNISLDSEYQSKLTYQAYGPQPSIDGVLYQPLKKFRALNGSFMELLRLTGGEVEGLTTAFEARQVSVSYAQPGRINAFHLHPKTIQDELWCVVTGRLLVWLVDVRTDSPTCGNKRQYLLSGEEPGLLYIPTGVAHGYRAGDDGAVLIYAMNAQFDAEDPNEGRLPWDCWGAELWEPDRG